MQTQEALEGAASETCAYFDVGGADLYTVLHAVEEPVAQVLLVGPFASERHTSYFAWVRWARFLATRGIAVLRYDYRGVGESTGKFTDMRFEHWADDVLQLARWLGERDRHVPLVLNGFELGALLAGRAFEEGCGDALLLWSAPETASQSLRSTLARWSRMRQAISTPEERRPLSYYIKELEADRTLRVEGYLWSGELWRDATRYSLPPALHTMNGEGLPGGRPVHSVDVWKSVTSLLKGGTIGEEQFEELDALYAGNLEWISSAVASVQRGQA